MEFLGVSLAAWMSILALTIVIIISCVNEELHVGNLSIAFGIVVGAIFMNMSGAKVVMGFPLSLFMILVGVTFMFAMAQVNGTLGKVTSYAIRSCGGNMMLLPLIIYLLTIFITTIGPGNIAGVALLAPICMAIAGQVRMSAFCMTLIVVGAANSACFSPFAPTGIISHGLVEKMGSQIPDLFVKYSINEIDWKVYFNSLVAQGIAVIPGFLALGGWKWMMQHKGKTVDINTIAPKPEPFNKQQWFTLACIVTLIVLIVVPALPGMKQFFPKWVLLMAANVGTAGFVLARPHDALQRGRQQGRHQDDALVRHHDGLRRHRPDRDHGEVGRSQRHGYGHLRLLGPHDGPLLAGSRHGRDLGLLELLRRRHAGLPAAGAGASQDGARRGCRRYDLVDQRRRPPRRCLAALHPGRALHRLRRRA